MMEVVLNFGFDCDCLGRWLKLGGIKAYRVLLEIWPDRGGFISVRKWEIWIGGVFFREKKEEMGNKGGQWFGQILFHHPTISLTVFSHTVCRNALKYPKPFYTTKPLHFFTRPINYPLNIYIYIYIKTRDRHVEQCRTCLTVTLY